MKDFEYKPAEYAGVTLSELTAALCAAIDGYHFQYHSGLGDVPMRRWREGVERFPVRIPADMERFDDEFALRFTREIGRKGIQFEYLYYNGDELAEMKSKMGTTSNVVFAVKPDDIRAIRVLHPTEGRYVPVQCLQEFAEPLPLFVHRSQLLSRKKAGRSGEDKNAARASSKFIETTAEKGRQRNLANAKLNRTEAEQLVRAAKAAQSRAAEGTAPPTTLIDELLAGRQAQQPSELPDTPSAPSEQ